MSSIHYSWWNSSWISSGLFCFFPVSFSEHNRARDEHLHTNSSFRRAHANAVHQTLSLHPTVLSEIKALFVSMWCDSDGFGEDWLSVCGCMCEWQRKCVFPKGKRSTSKSSMRTGVALSDGLSVDNSRMLSFGPAAQCKLHGTAACAHRACSRWKHNYTRLPSLLPACHHRMGLISCVQKTSIQIYSPAPSTNLYWLLKETVAIESSPNTVPALLITLYV